MGGRDCGPEKGLTRCGDRGAFLQFRLRLFNHNVFQLVEMLNCYRKHIEVDGGSQNYRGTRSTPENSRSENDGDSSPQRNAGTHVWFPDNGAGRI